jgi:hypothetical protein
LGNREGSRGNEEDVDEGTRGATSAQIGAVAEEVPSSHLPPVTYQELPDPLPLRKVLGYVSPPDGPGLGTELLTGLHERPDARPVASKLED